MVRFVPFAGSDVLTEGVRMCRRGFDGVALAGNGA
jgi:hypothetical protein